MLMMIFWSAERRPICLETKMREEVILGGEDDVSTTRTTNAKEEGKERLKSYASEAKRKFLFPEKMKMYFFHGKTRQETQDMKM